MSHENLRVKKWEKEWEAEELFPFSSCLDFSYSSLFSIKQHKNPYGFWTTELLSASLSLPSAPNGLPFLPFPHPRTDVQFIPKYSFRLQLANHLFQEPSPTSPSLCLLTPDNLSCTDLTRTCLHLYTWNSLIMGCLP